MDLKKFRTALIIVAPHEVQAIAHPLMRQYAPDSAIRVPAHITLMFPFVPFERLSEASPALQTLAENIAPFEVTMEGYGSFPTVAFMQPRDPQPIQQLFRQVFAAFPEYPPYEGRFGSDLHPHMTVGEFISEAEQRVADLPAYTPITFRVERLHLIYGTLEAPLPWITYSVISLGG